MLAYDGGDMIKMLIEEQKVKEIKTKSVHTTEVKPDTMDTLYQGGEELLSSLHKMDDASVIDRETLISIKG
jgi:hypothetical protein